jgi:hypothetical protein
VKELWEGNLKVTFDETWQCAKWDDCPSYRHGIGRLQGSDGVDFLGVRAGCLYLIEVKNYREYRIENRGKHENLPQVITVKVRDTIAGVVGASIMKKSDGFARECTKAIGETRDEQRIRVVAWIIEDNDLPPKDRIRAGVRRKTLVAQLRWLTTKVVDANPLRAPQIPGVEVVLERRRD